MRDRLTDIERQKDRDRQTDRGMGVGEGATHIVILEIFV